MQDAIGRMRQEGGSWPSVFSGLFRPESPRGRVQIPILSRYRMNEDGSGTHVGYPSASAAIQQTRAESRLGSNQRKNFDGAEIKMASNLNC